jgi:hypothetical protein
MGRHKKIQAVREVHTPEIVAEMVVSTVSASIDEDTAGVYAFPTRSRCPRCGSLDTQRIGQRDNIQYRICHVAICRNRYKVIGTKI